MSESDKEIKSIVEEKVIRHIVELPEGANDPEKKKLQDELSQKTGIIETLALTKFEDAQSEAVEKYPAFSEQLENVQTGPELENLVAVLETIKPDALPKVKGQPKGKVSMKISGQIGGLESAKEVVDEVYNELETQMDMLRRGSKDYDINKHREAQNKADKLLRSAIKGQKDRKRIELGWKVWFCHSCNKSVLNQEFCPTCQKKCGGYDSSPKSGDLLDRRTSLR